MGEVIYWNKLAFVKADLLGHKKGVIHLISGKRAIFGMRRKENSHSKMWGQTLTSFKRQKFFQLLCRPPSLAFIAKSEEKWLSSSLPKNQFLEKSIDNEASTELPCSTPNCLVRRISLALLVHPRTPLHMWTTWKYADSSITENVFVIEF